MAAIPTGYQWRDGAGYVNEADNSGPYAMNSAGVMTLMAGGGGASLSVIDPNNSTTTPLGIGAVFTGAWVDVTQYTSITVVPFADQASATNGFSIQQSSNGINADVGDSYTVSANAAKNIGVLVVQQYMRVMYTNGSVAQGLFRMQTIFHGLQQHGSSVKPADGLTIENDMEQAMSVQMLLNPATGLQEIQRGNATQGSFTVGYEKAQRTYSATVNVAAAASATDIATITGSATATVYVTKVIISGIQTSAGQANIAVVKRSTANTAGTSTSGTPVPHDSNDAAASATVLAYTANPTLGSVVGTVRQNYQPIGVASAAVTSAAAPYEFGDKGRPMILRGIAQVLAVNLNGVTLLGGTFDVTFEWFEI